MISISKYKILRNVVFLSFCIYFSQGFLLSQSIVTTLSGTLYIFIGLCAWVKIAFISKDRLVNFLSIFVIINIIYWLIGPNNYVSFSGEIISTFGILKYTLITLLSYFTFTFLSLKNAITHRFLIYSFLIYSFLFIGDFYHEKVMLLLESENVVNNSAYSVLSLMPFVFMIKRKYISLIVLFVLYVIVLSAMKRGAIIIATACVCLYLVYFFKNNKKRIKLWSVVLIIIVIGFLYRYLYYFYVNNPFLQYRIQATIEGSSSGRDIIMTNLLTKFFDGNLLNQLFGFGFYKSIEIAGNAAHNDWLEILISFGLIGVILYLLIFFQMFQTLKTVKDISLKYMMISCICIWFLKSIFSMGYMDVTLIPILLLISFIKQQSRYVSTR